MKKIAELKTSTLYFDEEEDRFFIDPDSSEGFYFDSYGLSDLCDSVREEIEEHVTGTIKISYPNDYNSVDDYQSAIDECGESEDAVLERLSESANGAGLQFLKATDFGAIWRGSKSQVNECLKNLPKWAYVDEFEPDNKYK